MNRSMTADDILPLIAGPTPSERVRLIRSMTERPDADDAVVYRAASPRSDEFPLWSPSRLGGGRVECCGSEIGAVRGME